MSSCSFQLDPSCKTEYLRTQMQQESIPAEAQVRGVSSPPARQYWYLLWSVHPEEHTAWKVLGKSGKSVEAAVLKMIQALGSSCVGSTMSTFSV